MAFQHEQTIDGLWTGDASVSDAVAIIHFRLDAQLACTPSCAADERRVALARCLQTQGYVLLDETPMAFRRDVRSTSHEPLFAYHLADDCSAQHLVCAVLDYALQVDVLLGHVFHLPFDFSQLRD